MSGSRVCTWHVFNKAGACRQKNSRTINLRIDLCPRNSGIIADCCLPTLSPTMSLRCDYVRAKLYNTIRYYVFNVQ